MLLVYTSYVVNDESIVTHIPFYIERGLFSSLYMRLENSPPFESNISYFSNLCSSAFTTITYLLSFFQSLLISSNVFPFVSGTQRHTKIAAATQIMPYKLYANIGLKSYNAGNVEETI